MTDEQLGALMLNDFAVRLMRIDTAVGHCAVDRHTKHIRARMALLLHGRRGL